jgi:hypothetical protein
MNAWSPAITLHAPRGQSKLLNVWPPAYRDCRVGMTVAPKALKRARDRIRPADHAQLGRLDAAADHRDPPLHGRVDGLLRVRRHLPAVRKFDKWLRRRLRQVRWKEWKRPQTRYRNLRALGIPDGDARSWAASQKGCWRVAGSWPLQTALPNAYWHKTMGLKGSPTRTVVSGNAERTAQCGPACRVLWEGQGEPGPYPIRGGGGRNLAPVGHGRAALAPPADPTPPLRQ